jgi:hypothetical protein
MKPSAARITSHSTTTAHLLDHLQHPRAQRTAAAGPRSLRANRVRKRCACHQCRISRHPTRLTRLTPLRVLPKERKLFLDATVELAAYGFPTTTYKYNHDAQPVRWRTRQKLNEDGRRAVPVRLNSSLMNLYYLDSSDALYPYRRHMKICFKLH